MVAYGFQMVFYDQFSFNGVPPLTDDVRPYRSSTMTTGKTLGKTLERNRPCQAASRFAPQKVEGKPSAVLMRCGFPVDKYIRFSLLLDANECILYLFIWLKCCTTFHKIWKPWMSLPMRVSEVCNQTQNFQMFYLCFTWKTKTLANSMSARVSKVM